MNKDIAIMVDLQRLWDRKIELEVEISHHLKSIAFWEKKISDAGKEIDELKENITKTEVEVRQSEKTMYEIEEKLKKLQKRRDVIKTAKELTALESEIATANTEKDEIETKAIELMEWVSNLKNKLNMKEASLAEEKPKTQSDVAYLKGKIQIYENEIKDLLIHFNEGLSKLPPEIKSRFDKTIRAKEGKAIAPLEGETCGACHTSIPVHIVMEASSGNKAMNCTNCGRFIYRNENLQGNI